MHCSWPRRRRKRPPSSTSPTELDESTAIAVALAVAQTSAKYVQRKRKLLRNNTDHDNERPQLPFARANGNIGQSREST